MGKGKKMITLREFKEKAVSKQQQKLMGLALAYKRGEVSDNEVSDSVKNMAKSMSEKELEDFAGTKHKGLPDKVDEAKSSSGYDLYHRDFSSAMQHAYKHAKAKLGVDVILKRLTVKLLLVLENHLKVRLTPIVCWIKVARKQFKFKSMVWTMVSMN